MSDVTHWAYTFRWKGIPCEAKNGSIFVNGRRVEEFSNVNHSAQTEERFFIEGQDVTNVILRYIGTETAKSVSLKTIGDLTRKAFEKTVLAPRSKAKNTAKAGKTASPVSSRQ